MRVALIVVMGVCVSWAAHAQDWTGTVLTPALLDGKPYTDSPIYGSYGGTLTPVAVYCHTNVPPDMAGECNQTQVNSGGRNWYLPSGPATRISALPNGIDAAGSKVAIQVTGIYSDSNAPSGVTGFSGYVPLSAFATQAQIDATNSRVDTLSTTVTQQGAHITVLDGQIAALNVSATALSTRLSSVEASQQSILANQQAILANQVYYNDALRAQHQELTHGIALASSLSMLAPALGSHNRLGFGVGSYADASAVSLNYTHQSGHIDYGAAAAFSGGDTLAKAGFGVSW